MDETYPIMLCVRVTQKLYDALEKARHLERRTRSQMTRILLEDALEAKKQETQNERDATT